MVFKVLRGSGFLCFCCVFGVVFKMLSRTGFFRSLVPPWNPLGPTGRDFGASWGPLGGPCGVQGPPKSMQIGIQIQRLAPGGQNEVSRGDLGVVLGSFLVSFGYVFIIVGSLFSIQRASRSLAKTGFF